MMFQVRLIRREEYKLDRGGWVMVEGIATIEIPFVPFVGLEILVNNNDLDNDEFEVSSLRWNHAEQRFDCYHSGIWEHSWVEGQVIDDDLIQSEASKMAKEGWTVEIIK